MTAVITGATRGIGHACAVLFKQTGYHVAGVYRSRDDIAETMTSEGFDMYKCDISMSSAVDDICHVVHADILINCAGIAQQRLFTDITPSEWDNMMNVNVRGAYNMIHGLLPGMIRRKYGRIINISSMWGETGASCEVHYSASKAALIGMTKALAKEVGPSGITVNCITPGVIDTDMNSGFDDDTIRELIEETPVGRIGKPEDIARTSLFLADERSDFITGQVIGVNGGMVI
ncbi:MAG: SDR family oxidoreductase [Oscillospiraceae bacterium]|nr:SDR family oxidoreductase [Oscillospiraceae bacterium]